MPGVAITDPRIVPNTKYIKKISYDDMYRLAISGANVIHPNAVLLGKQYNIPIRILSTFIDCPGTVKSLTSNYMLPVIIILGLVGAVIGAYIGRGLLNKHFKRGGIA